MIKFILTLAHYFSRKLIFPKKEEILFTFEKSSTYFEHLFSHENEIEHL